MLARFLTSGFHVRIASWATRPRRTSPNWRRSATGRRQRTWTSMDLFTDIPRSRVKRVAFEVTFDDAATEPLLGKVNRVGNFVRENDGGTLRVSGRLRNSGSVQTYFNQMNVDVRNGNDKVIDCDVAFVMGSSVTLPNGNVTDTGLDPGERMPFETLTRAPFAKAKVINKWVSWYEDDPAEDPEAASTDPGSMRRYQSLRDEMAMLAGTDPEVATQRGRAEARERLTEQIRQIERDASQP